MNRSHRFTREAGWVAWLVALHVVVALAHGAAHLALAVVPPAVDDIFIVVVIGLAPVMTLPFVLRGNRVGMGVLALALAASWLYGAINHFFVSGADHVRGLDAGAWQATFTITAAGLFVLEAMGTLLAARLFWRASRSFPRHAPARPFA